MPVPFRDVLRHLEAFIAMTGFAIMILAVLGNVLMRFATGTSLVFTEEIAYLAFGWSIFFGASLLFRQRALIAVDLVVDLLPAKVRRAAHGVNCLILVILCGYFCKLSLGLALTGWVRRTAFLEIPYFWVNLAPSIAFGLMTLYSIGFLAFGLRSGEQAQ